MSRTVEILDTTLRDGVQSEGISYSIKDKLNIVLALDGMGISIIEAGNPSSGPKDMEFFTRLSKIKLRHSRIAVFGSTRKKNIPVDQDEFVAALVTADVPLAVIFGKSWDLHVSDVLNTTGDENLRMIADTVRYIKSRGKEVIFDAEHFFDGYKANREYALETVSSAIMAGASTIVLCDTNGSAFPDEIFEITKDVVTKFDAKIGIHCHNDTGLAVAGALMAVTAGAVHVQGTFLGNGERCGNANLSTIIPNLQLKRHIFCVPEEALSRITETARYIAEVSNQAVLGSLPYVGASAFAHKAGMHADAVYKLPISFEHIDPELVGNTRRFLISEISGKTVLLKKIESLAHNLSRDSDKLTQILSKLKNLEKIGYQFEGAEGSFEIFVRKELDMYTPFFRLKKLKTIEEQPSRVGQSASALIKIEVEGKSEMAAAEGDGPVHALDRALRKALEVFYPTLKTVRLIDFKVRVLDPQDATASRVRVLMTSSDGQNDWSTVGVSSDIIQASWLALVDSLEYKLIRDNEDKYRK